MAKCKGLSRGQAAWCVGWWDLDISKLNDFHQSGCDQKLHSHPKMFQALHPPRKASFYVHMIHMYAPFKIGTLKSHWSCLWKKTPISLEKKTLVAWKKSYQSHQAGFAGDDDVSKRQRFFQGVGRMMTMDDNGLKDRNAVLSSSTKKLLPVWVSTRLGDGERSSFNIQTKAFSRWNAVDERNPKQPPGMYRSLQILGYLPYQLVNAGFFSINSMIWSPRWWIRSGSFRYSLEGTRWQLFPKYYPILPYTTII